MPCSPMLSLEHLPSVSVSSKQVPLKVMRREHLVGRAYRLSLACEQERS